MSDDLIAADIFVLAAKALWGEDWHERAAKALRLNIRTVQRIHAASRASQPAVIPRGVMDDLHEMLNEHSGRCRRIADRMDRGYAGIILE